MQHDVSVKEMEHNLTDDHSQLTRSKVERNASNYANTLLFNVKIVWPAELLDIDQRH